VESYRQTSFVKYDFNDLVTEQIENVIF